MKLPITGGCICKSIRYECSVAPLGMGNCHCRDCQYSSGTGYSSVFAVPASAVKITGKPKYYESFSDTGIKPRLCSSHLLRSQNPCCNTRFTILILNRFMNMPAGQNCSNFVFRLGFLNLATFSTAQSGLKPLHSGVISFRGIVPFFLVDMNPSGFALFIINLSAFQSPR